MVDAGFRGSAWSGLRFGNLQNSAHARRRRYSAVVGTDSCESIAKAYGIVLRRNRQTWRRRLFGFDQARSRIHHARRLDLILADHPTTTAAMGSAGRRRDRAPLQGPVIWRSERAAGGGGPEHAEY